MQSHSSRTIANYRARGLWGGAFLGALAGAIIAGQFIHGWASSLWLFLAAIVVPAAVCALIGLLFFELRHGHPSTSAAETGEDSRRDEASHEPDCEP